MRLDEIKRRRIGTPALAVIFAMAFAGLPPARRAESGQSGAVSGTITVKQKGLFGTSAKSDRSGAVVFLENVPAPSSLPLTNLARVRQRDKSFEPRTIAITRGSSVEFPNDDKIFHNVFSLSQGGKFDLGLYKSGVSKTVVFDRVGVIDVYCNIHPEMEATIRVFDTPYFAVTDKSGAFQIPGVPPGVYPIVAWIPRGKEARGRVTVTGGGTARVDLELLEEPAAPNHARKDGTPYGRYQ